MTSLRKINFVLVTALSITAGIPKLMRLPQEIGFFERAGLTDNSVVVFGLLQVAGGVFLVFRKTRRWGAAVAATTFSASAVMLFLTGQNTFALVSVVPVLMAAVVLVERARNGMSAEITTVSGER